MTIEQQSDRASRGISPSLQDNSVGGEIDLSELARTLWRGKFFIVLCAAIALIFGIWYLVFGIWYLVRLCEGSSCLHFKHGSCA